MRYLTREWFALVQMENRLRYLKKLPEGNWDEGEIRSFVRREREAYVLREQKEWALWAKGQTEEMKAAQPFDPAESAAWFNSSWKVLYWELYREEGQYEVRLMLTNGEKQPYLALRCREIEWACLADPA